MKRSRAALTFFLTTFGLSLMAVGSTCSRSGAADAQPHSSCTTKSETKAPEPCTRYPSDHAADFGTCGGWYDDWQPPRNQRYDSLKRQATATITGLMHLIGETASTAADPGEGRRHESTVTQRNFCVEYGCEGYEADTGWYEENECLAEERCSSTIESFQSFAAWRDLSSLAADPRHSQGQVVADQLNADNDGLADEPLDSCDGRAWHAMRAAQPATANSTCTALDAGLDCDYSYCGNAVAAASATATGGMNQADEIEWEFGESAASQGTTESRQNLRPAMLATAKLLEQLGSVLSGWGRDLQEAATQIETELTAASDRETWGL